MMNKDLKLTRRDFLVRSSLMAGAAALMASPLPNFASANPIITTQDKQGISAYQIRADLRRVPFDSHEFGLRYRAAVEQGQSWLF